MMIHPWLKNGVRKPSYEQLWWFDFQGNLNNNDCKDKAMMDNIKHDDCNILYVLQYLKVDIHDMRYIFYVGTCQKQYNNE